MKSDGISQAAWAVSVPRKTNTSPGQRELLVSVLGGDN